jgi:uncharacterized phage protein gp47/JayE
MAILTSQDFSAQMVAQLRILDPSISAEVGTPERKIIDTVSLSLADNQVDLTGLSSATDITSKYGSNLDQFTNLFGFARQGSTYATGYVVFSRNTPAPATITIPAGITVQSNTLTANGQYLQYSTTTGGSIPQGTTQSAAVLVQCTVAGDTGNASANTLTNLVGVGVGATITYGVTAVTNPAPLTTGNDAESDSVYKTRFQNTIFRNLAGTQDQYLALALSTTFSTKSNVIGPVSTYQEYIQIPDVDDSGSLAGVTYGAHAYLPSGSQLGPIASTSGVLNQWTTSLSAIPYAQDIYLNPPPIITNGDSDGTYFYRQGTDYIFNYPPTIYGDTVREGETSKTAPNFTFLNVFNPPNSAPPLPGLQTATPGGVMLSEFRYLSAASRNSIQHNVYSCVDVYVDGSNPTDASCVFLPGLTLFTANPTDVLYIENFRRDGEPVQRPHVGNFFTPLFQSPLTSLPNTITITIGTSVYNYYLGYHYWLIHEVSVLGGTVRARDGIEWNGTLNADDAQLGIPGAQPPLPYAPPLAPYSPGTDVGPGARTIAYPATSQTQVEVDDYFYDANITTLQATMEAARPETIDVLAHSAQLRYFKPDITVVYTPNVNQAVTNSAISASLTAYFNNQLFGSVCLLSDILALVQQTPGVANVRWSNDLPSVPNMIRVYETDINGYPLHTPWIDRVIAGSTGNAETQRLYIPAFGTFGGPVTATGYTGDSFQLQWIDATNSVSFLSNVISFSGLTAASLTTAIQAGTGYPSSGMYYGMTATLDAYSGTATHPMQSFTINYSTSGTPVLPSVVNVDVSTSYYDYDQDFYLRDNELAAAPTGMAPNDTVTGAIIRPRAPGTFVRPGIG